MTVRFLMDYGVYPQNSIVTLDAGTETGLINAKMASATLTGGVVYVPPVAQTIYTADGEIVNYEKANNHIKEHAALGIPAGVIVLNAISGDATTKIQAALDALGALPTGGKLVLNAGVFLISNTLHVPSNVSVEGAGIGKTILRSTGVSFTGYTHSGGYTTYALLGMSGVTNVGIRHLTLDAFTNLTEISAVAITPSGLSGTVLSGFSSRITIEGILALGSVFHQYIIWNQGGTDIKILNNQVDGNVATPAFAANFTDHNGIEVYGGTNVLIQGNTVRNVNYTGILVESAAGYTGANLNNKNIVIANNFIENVSNGIEIQGISDVAKTSTNRAEGVNVYGNTIKGYTFNGIKLYSNVAGSAGGGDKLADINIHNNSIDSNGVTAATNGYAVNIQFPASENFYRNIKFNNNTLTNILSPAASHSIKMQYPRNIEMQGNYFVNANLSVALLIGPTDMLIANNIFDTYIGKSLEIQAATRVKIHGNIFKGGLTNTTYNVWFTSASTYCEVTNNSFNTLNNYAQIVDHASSDYTKINGNKFNYVNAVVAPIIAAGTNLNYGITAAVSAGTLTIPVAYTNTNSTDLRMKLTQIAGAVPTAFKIAYTSTGATITVAANADGLVQFAYEIP